MTYLTPKQLAAEWNCSAGHIRKLLRTGQLAGMRLGSDWRVSDSAAEAFEAGHTTEPKPAPRQIGYREPAVAVIVSPSYQPGEMDGALPERWWENRQTLAALPAAGRSRSAGKKKAVSVRS